MKLKSLSFVLVLPVLVTLVNAACKKKQEKTEPAAPEVCKASYINTIKPIVQSKCALSGCHVSNFPFGDYTAYGPLKVRVDNGKIKKFVFDNKVMPPDGSPQLSQDELETIKCWMDNGAFEN